MSRNSNNGSKQSGSSPENDSGMGLQQIIQMGEAASQLLNNPLYQMAHKLAVDQAIVEWSQTSPKEKEKRDSLWHEVQAHGRTAEIMRGCIERAQQVLQDQAGQQDPGKEYLDRQGFGFTDSYSENETFN